MKILIYWKVRWIFFVLFTNFIRYNHTSSRKKTICVYANQNVMCRIGLMFPSCMYNFEQNWESIFDWPIRIVWTLQCIHYLIHVLFVPAISMDINSYIAWQNQVYYQTRKINSIPIKERQRTLILKKLFIYVHLTYTWYCYCLQGYDLNQKITNTSIINVLINNKFSIWNQWAFIPLDDAIGRKQNRVNASTWKENIWIW